MKLYTYFRSSAAYRVRIALALKGLTVTHIPVHLLQDGGQQFSPGYTALNPQQLVPALEDEGQVFTQSLAILEYLEERHPQVPLLPAGAADRAHVRALALAVACDLHPLNNLRVQRYLTDTLGLGPDQKDAWLQHWMQRGLRALEQAVAPHSGGRFCWGDRPSIADCVLIPQLYNARRMACPLADYPTLTAIEAHCNALPAFVAASPAQQADAPAPREAPPPAALNSPTSESPR